MHLYETPYELDLKYHDNFLYNNGDFLLPSSSTLDSSHANKTHLDSLISFDTTSHPSAGMVFSTSPIMSPPSTANTQVDTRIFQFPNPVKQEDFMSCLQDEYSPMAVSPANMSTLNTPRGSITSMRSQQSPMDQNPPPVSHHPVDPVDPIMSSYDAFEAAFPTYPSQNYQNYPSPPGSPIVSSTTNFQPYDDYFTMPQAQETVPNMTFANQSSVLTTYTSTPDPTESFVSSDTCPETPDSSVKEEADLVNSPDTGSYVCLWQDCAEEFVTQKALVEHINENHMDNKKGCEEFPCMWKDCSRKSKAFNAKYKLITHMRVHTKEKPYLCLHEGCNRAFARSENRKIHMRSHSGEKPFNCKYAQEFNCTKKFSNSSDRAKHEQTHKDPKPYKCEVLGCTKRYTDPSSLRKHVKSHSAEEQEQYRRTKDMNNLAKRSTSPTARYSSWTPGPSTMNQGVILEEHVLTSSSTLLQTGGTLLTVEDFSSSSPGVPSPLVQQKSREPSQRNESYPHHPHHHPHHQALAHQQNSLDDLDNDTIPFDNVPVRYDGSDLYNEMTTEWPSN